MREEGKGIVLRKLAETDPGRALELAKIHGETALAGTLQRAAVSKMVAEEGVDSALDWIEGLDDSQLASDLRKKALSTLLDQNLAEGLDYAVKLLEGDDLRSTVRQAFTNGAIGNRQEAAEAFRNFPEEHLDQGAAFQFGQFMSLTDPEDALAYGVSLTGTKRETYLNGFFMEQAGKDPVKTAERVTNYIDDEQVLAMIYENLAGSWAGKDEFAAAEWLANLPESPARDDAVKGFSKKLFSLDPERAVQWAASIQDSEQRSEQLATLVSQWRALDADAANAWVSQSKASAERQ